MLERLRSRPRLLLGITLIIVGSVLLVLGISFVTVWLQILSLEQTAGHPPTSCGPAAGGGYCQFVINLWAPPDPWVLVAAYGVAIPVVFASAWGMLRSLRRGAASTPTFRRWSRAASWLLMGTLTGVGAFIVAAFALDWLSIQVPLWIHYLFLASLVVAPSIFLGVGAACVGAEGRRRLSGRSRAARG